MKKISLNELTGLLGLVVAIIGVVVAARSEAKKTELENRLKQASNGVMILQQNNYINNGPQDVKALLNLIQSSTTPTSEAVFKH